MQTCDLDFAPPEEPRTEDFVPQPVRHRLVLYDFPDLFGVADMPLGSRATLCKAIEDVGLDVDQTIREAEALCAAARDEWSEECDAGEDAGPGQPCEQTGLPAEDPESESQSSEVEPEDADDVPPSQERQYHTVSPEHKACLTFFDNIKANTPRATVEFESQEKLFGLFLKPPMRREEKGDAPIFIRGRCTGARSKANTSGAALICLDLDSTDLTLKEVSDRLALFGIDHVGYTTWSHGLKPKNCFRIITDVLAPASHLECATRELVAEIGLKVRENGQEGDVDPASWTTLVYYMPALQPDRAHLFETVVVATGGSDWRPTSTPESLPQGEIPVGDQDVDAVRGDFVPEDVRPLLMFLAANDLMATEADWTTTGMAMAYWNHPEAQEILDEASAEAGGAYDAVDNQKRFDRFSRNAAKPGTKVTLASLMKDARAHGYTGTFRGPSALDDFKDLIEAEAERRRGSEESSDPGESPSAKSERDREARVVSLFVTDEEWESDSEPDAIVENMIFGPGSNLVTGASKSGKSYAIYQAALCVGSGKPFLGLETVESKVLLISLEMPAAAVRNRMQAISRSTGIPSPEELRGAEMLDVIAPVLAKQQVPALTFADDEGAEFIGEAITYSDAKVVILDTLYRFIGGLNPLDNGDMGEVFGRINTLAVKTGAAIIVLDHVAGKGNFPNDLPVSQRGLGAQTKGGASNSIIHLARSRREQGDTWDLDVEAHYGEWQKPIHYGRPRLADGTLGWGCKLISAADAKGLDVKQIELAFFKHGETSEQGGWYFASRKALLDAFRRVGIIRGQSNREDEEVARVLRAEFCYQPGEDGGLRPILLEAGKGNHGGHRYTWVETDVDPCS